MSKDWHLSDDEIKNILGEVSEDSTGDEELDNIIKKTMTDDEEVDENLLSDLLGDNEVEGEGEKKRKQEPVGKKPVEVKNVALEELTDDQESYEEMIPGFETLHDVPIEIRVLLGSAKKTIEEILAMKVDSIIKLSKLAGEPVEVIAGDHIVAKGEIVVIDDRFGVLITEIISPKERIKSVESNLKSVKID